MLVGLYKHGLGMYEDIREDPNLCFSKMAIASDKGK